MRIYWASVFILPSRVLLDIKQIMRGFLWCQGSMRKGKAKVAWDIVCLPKDEGGLGLRRLDLFNKALMVSHIWSSCLVKRPCFDLSTKVRDVVVNGFWNWPIYLHDKYPFLCSVASPNLVEGSHDQLVWYNGQWVVKKFSVHQVWNHLKSFAGLSSSRPDFNHILSILMPIAKRKSSRSVIAKLVVATSAYFVWQERNNRLFKNNNRSVKQLIECITSSVRLKLLSCRFKKSNEGVRFAQLWSLPVSLLMDWSFSLCTIMWFFPIGVIGYVFGRL
ncbi:hypothetical protein Tco_0815873 [Tanacetum coccineum]